MLNLILSFEFISFFFSKFASIALIVIAIYLLVKEKNKTYLKKIDFNIYNKIFLLFFLWLIINNIFFAVDKELSFVETAKLFVICIFGFIASKLAQRSPYPKYENKYFFALIILNILMIYEHLFNYSISKYFRLLFHYNADDAEPINRLSAFNLMISPILYNYVKDKNKLSYLLVIVIAINYLVHPMDAAKLAFVTSVILYFIYILLGELIVKIYFAVIILLGITLPFLIKYFIRAKIFTLTPLKDSWLHRVQIWQETIRLINERPIEGWGINASRVISEIIPIHPHNMFLQVWLELGMIGMYLISLFLFGVYAYIIRSKTPLTLLISFNICLCFALVSFGAWQSWWVSSIWIVVITYNYLNANDKNG